jgi:hypothetical protein
MRLSDPNLSCKRRPEADRLWLDFLEARGRALDTLRIEDAARAGRAWSRFLAAFVADCPTLVPGRSA